MKLTNKKLHVDLVASIEIVEPQNRRVEIKGR
jgi:hypothetical protein